MKRTCIFKCQLLGEFSKVFRFCKAYIEYWVGKQVIVHLGVFGLDIIIRTGSIAPP